MKEEQAKGKGPQSVNIELPAEIARGVYTNLAVISHSDAEFVLDFIQIFPGAGKAEVRSRVILSPINAKRLLHALGENVEKYEDSFGEIRSPQQEINLPPGFSGPLGYA
jgi:hypothetical protein